MRGAAILLLVVTVCPAPAVDRIERELNEEFTTTVRPFLESYCFACHGELKQKGKLDLRPYSSLDAVAMDYRRWNVVLDKLKANEMPPEEAKQFPATESRQHVIAWIQAMRKNEARKNAGDPGPVLAHRLSNAEYDYTIRDLTGIDLKPAREFPVDPANQAGFDNSGESLAMSPALLTKYLAAARSISEHLVFKPDGLVFAPHPVVSESDRDKYSVARIINFYQRHSTNLADYFTAAWRFRHRATLGQRKLTLTELAATNKISARYLATIWSTLNDSSDRVGPIAALQTMWKQLPAPARGRDSISADVAKSGCLKMSTFVMRLRQLLQPAVTNLAIQGIAPGSQPFVLWKDQQYAANRQRIRDDLQTLQSVASLISQAGPEKVGDDPEADAVRRVLEVPTDEPGRRQYQSAMQRFGRIFPDAFYVPERGLIFLKEDKESKGRLLSAGFHLMTGYFRDDAPLSALLLDEAERRELDQLWEEFHAITLDSIRQYKDYIFFERAEPPRFMQGAEFDFARSEDKDSTSEVKIQQLAKGYLAKARRNGGDGTAIAAIENYFKSISEAIRHIEQTRRTAEPKHLEALQTFAERAYRRPLSRDERNDLLNYYHQLRKDEGLDHEDAIRDTIVSVLMSPAFCYRGALDQLKAGLTWKAQPLSDFALASRLSYFLWSSMPDAELWAHAQAGDLRRPTVLLSQTRRMIRDDRIRRLATEFGGNWLDFRRFEEHNAVDRTRFTTFNNELRAAMFEEPIRFFVDVVRRDRSILDFLDAGDTFVNPVLAAHYGMPNGSTHSNEWRHIENARAYGRGGLLPMSVFLTKNAPGLRTSPVKRGYWVVRRLLGEEIPPPPPKVPELPTDEAQLGERTLREVLARHREDKSCAGCHARFDGVGLAFEDYGPIGERRIRDLGGRPVDTHTIFPGGGEGDGVNGLRRYLHDVRQEEFIDNLCRKMLAYALGRTLLLSDDMTIEAMRANLAAHENRFSNLIETIVISPQFRMRRVAEQ